MRVTYVWRNHSVRSLTSLPLLLGIPEPRATLMLVCDTVACPNNLGGRCGYVDLVEAVKRKYEDFINTGSVMQGSESIVGVWMWPSYLASAPSGIESS